MKKTTGKKRLELATQTLRTLADQQLVDVDGGLMANNSFMSGCASCPKTDCCPWPY